MNQIFPEKPPCKFRDIMGPNIHAKYKENPWSGFREKLRTNQPTNLTNGSDLMGPGDIVAGPK